MENVWKMFLVTLAKLDDLCTNNEQNKRIEPYVNSIHLKDNQTDNSTINSSRNQPFFHQLM